MNHNIEIGVQEIGCYLIKNFFQVNYGLTSCLGKILYVVILKNYKRFILKTLRAYLH